MKKILVVSLLLFVSQLYAADDCDLFKQEVAVISEQIQGMYKEMYEAKDFVKTAKERKTESDNQKLGRYMSSIKKELELIEHGMSQLKLHQDCACEGFKFQYVDNTLIEVKYWLKKAQSIERVKPKKTNYDVIASNLGKSMEKATSLQVYFLKPCGGGAVAIAEEKVEAPTTEEQLADTTSVAKEAVEETPKKVPVAVASAAIDTVSQMDVPKAEAEKSEETAENIPEKEEEGVETNSEPENENAASNSENTGESPSVSTGGGNSSAGAVVAGTVAAAGVAVAVVAKNNDKDSTKQKIEEPNSETAEIVKDSSEVIDDIFAEEPKEIVEEEEEVAIVAPVTVMDTVKHKDVSTGSDQEEKSPEEQPENSTENESNVAANAVDGVSESTSAGEAVVAGTAVAAGVATAAVLSSNNKDSSKTKEDQKNTETTAVAMDTVKHTDVSQEPAMEAEQIEEVPEPEVKVAAAPVIDTVKHTDVSVAAKIEEVPEEKPESVTPPQPKVKAPVVAVAAAPVVKPSKKVAPEPEAVAAPVPNGFHYAVQISTGNVNVSDSKYSSLGEEVYSVNESGMTKNRVGKYKSFDEAKTSKNKAFSVGFIDAFVVVYNNGERISFAEARDIENGGATVATKSNKKSKAAAISTTEKIKTPKLKKNDNVFLAVQIGAILSSTDPVYELIKYERMVGMEVHVLHGDPMRFYTGKAITAANADAILNRVRSAGVKEAFLIGVSNEKRIDYNAALKHLGL